MEIEHSVKKLFSYAPITKGRRSHMHYYDQ